MMVPKLLYFAWVAFALLLLSLLVYRGTLTRYEDEKLFLDENDASGEKTQADIIRRVTRLQPLVTAIGTATAITSLGIIGMYVYDAIRVLQS